MATKVPTPVPDNKSTLSNDASAKDLKSIGRRDTDEMRTPAGKETGPSVFMTNVKNEHPESVKKSSSDKA